MRMNKRYQDEKKEKQALIRMNKYVKMKRKKNKSVQTYT